MLKAALFDMDGLMFDTERIYDDAWQSAATQYNITITPEFITSIRGTNDLQLRRLCENEFGTSFDYDRFRADAAKIVEKILSQNVPHRPYLTDMLNYLKARGIKMAVASSTNSKTVALYLEKAGVKHYFDAIIGGEMVKNSKPMPDIFQTAAAALNEKPENCAAFEDSYNGIKSASAAGCITVMVPDLDKPTPEITALCSNVSCNLKEAINFLEGLQ